MGEDAPTQTLLMINKMVMMMMIRMVSVIIIIIVLYINHRTMCDLIARRFGTSSSVIARAVNELYL